MNELNQEMLPDHILDELYEARGRWERKEWLNVPRVVGSVALGGTGIDDALDVMNQHIQAVSDFERVFCGTAE